MYLFRVSHKPSQEELKWAFRFSVLVRDEYRCQNCGTETPPIDVAHMLSRTDRPDLVFDPSNGKALCRSCHLKHDHTEGHRPSGRPKGLPHTEETKRRISEASKKSHRTPKYRAWASEKARREWAARGRKHPLRNCDSCEQPLTSKQCSRRARFCSSVCHYSYRTGKPRAGY